MEPLPDPNSDAVSALGLSWVERAIYLVLYENRSNPLTIHEIRDKVAELNEAGKLNRYGNHRGGKRELGSQEHFNRRLRELYQYFEFRKERHQGQFKYEIVGVKSLIPSAGRLQIPKRIRAEVLSSQRCAFCGRTPVDDGVRLHVDHKVPKSWGGSDDIQNLQALCSECNEGKQAYFSDVSESVALEVRKAANFDEPHRRIAEALIAAYPNEIPSFVLGAIASAKQFQEDWQKRMRELRTLGFSIGFRREKGKNRSLVYYRLTEKPPPLPQGNLRAEIRRREKAQRNNR